MRVGWWRIGVLFGLVLAHGTLAARAMGESAAEVQPVPFSSSMWPAILVRPAQSRLPQLQKPHLLDYALYGSIAGYRSFDYLSTRHAIAAGAHEVVLPEWVVDHSGTLIAFEGLATTTEVASSVWLIRHRHRQLARTMNMFSVGIGVNTVLHNYDQGVWSPVTAGR